MRAILLTLVATLAFGEEVLAPIAPDRQVEVSSGIPYRDPGQDAYVREQCVLDLYLPAKREGAALPLLVWFHGGGLEGGDKADDETAALCRSYAAAGVAVASPNYRLSPKVAAPAYIEDAAACVAWILTHASAYGVDPRSVFLSGHSAGGYLVALLAADPAYMQAAGVRLDAIAGVIPVSGQMITHFTIRKERGLANPQRTPVIDEMAPCWHAAKAKGMPPLLLICGDKDWVARAEENRYFLAMLRSCGARDATYLEVPERNHRTIYEKMSDPADPARQAILAFIATHHSRL